MDNTRKILFNKIINFNIRLDLELFLVLTVVDEECMSCYDQLGS